MDLTFDQKKIRMDYITLDYFYKFLLKNVKTL